MGMAFTFHDLIHEQTPEVLVQALVVLCCDRHYRGPIYPQYPVPSRFNHFNMRGHRTVGTVKKGDKNRGAGSHIPLNTGVGKTIFVEQDSLDATLHPDPNAVANSCQATATP